MRRFLQTILILCLAGVTHAATWETATDTLRNADTLIRCNRDQFITASRIPVKFIDIPSPVYRIDDQDFRFEKRVSSGDVLRFVPGLFLQSPYGNNDFRYSLRGFGARSNTGIRGMRILLDQIPETDPDGTGFVNAIDFNTIRHVEIAEGNSTSLYSGAPGGVAGFFTDLDFDRSSVTLFNQAGSDGMLSNGFKTAVKSGSARFLASYNHLRDDGYRDHSREFRHLANLALETYPSVHSRFAVLGNFVSGETRNPGALNKTELEADPFQANPVSFSRDEKVKTTKGRVGIQYNTVFGKRLNNRMDVTAFASLRYLEQVNSGYNLITRYGLGISILYSNQTKIGSGINEFTVGGDIEALPSRIENFNNNSGSKGDLIRQILNETSSVSGFFLSDRFEILKQKLYGILTCRFNHVHYGQTQQMLPSLDDSKSYNSINPKLAFNFFLHQNHMIFVSGGMDSEAPGMVDLASPDSLFLVNHNLQPVKPIYIETGFRGGFKKPERTFLTGMNYQFTAFYLKVGDEIIPNTVSNTGIYTNKAESQRPGLEAGATAELVKNLNFRVAYTLSPYQWLSYQVLDDRTMSDAPFPTYRDFSKNHLPGVPLNNLYLSLDYTLHFQRHNSLYGRLGYQSVSEMWVNDENTEKTNGYHLMDITLGADLRFGHFNLLCSGGIRNIFDETYTSFIQINASDQRYYYAGAPRNFYLSVTLGYFF